MSSHYLQQFFLYGAIAFLSVACSSLPEENETRIDISIGRQLAFERSKGNCLACHAIADGNMSGNIGPPLADMASRFASKDALKARIWDATQYNPRTSMPPFGKNRILTEQEIDAIVEYLWTL